MKNTKKRYYFQTLSSNIVYLIFLRISLRILDKMSALKTYEDEEQKYISI